MQVQVDIGFEQLVELVKALPEAQLTQLMHEIENKHESSIAEMKAFLLTGPIFSESQIDSIAQTRAAINKWRAK